MIVCNLAHSITSVFFAASLAASLRISRAATSIEAIVASYVHRKSPIPKDPTISGVTAQRMTHQLVILLSVEPLDDLQLSPLCTDIDCTVLKLSKVTL